MEGYSNRIQLMTFGKPRIGNSVFSKFFDSKIKSKWRIVNQKDLIPRLPPRFLGYQHSVQEIWFEKNEKDFKFCDANNGEDSKCSLSVKLPVPWNYHIRYLGFNKHDGAPFECR